MSLLSRIKAILTRWYVAAPLVAVAVMLVGAYLIVNVVPGRPQVGIISIPYTVINEESAYIITSYLDYARRNDRIKAVVITLSSPGGGATSSERLYIETKRLRQDKPVVLVMNDLVASGGFMMSMGANYTYAKSSSLVGNVGVVAGTGPYVPEPPPESVLFTGPSKLTGSTRRDWAGLMDLLKQSFAQMVIQERGDKLKITPQELTEGRLYAGMEAVRVGLVDDIGDDSAAIDKAASMAHISNYELLDVNVEVDRLFVHKVRRVFETSAGDGESLDIATLMGLTSGNINSQTALGPAEGLGADQEQSASLGDLRRFMLAGTLTQTQDEPLPNFPLEIHRPDIYYMYAGQIP